MTVDLLEFAMKIEKNAGQTAQEALEDLLFYTSELLISAMSSDPMGTFSTNFHVLSAKHVETWFRHRAAAILVRIL